MSLAHVGPACTFDRSGGPCPSLMWPMHEMSVAYVVHRRSCGPCMKRPSLMWASVVMWSKSLAQVVHVPRSCGPGMIAQVVHVPRSCGPGMHFRSLRWSMSLAHVAHARNVRRLCGPPSVMWPMHETSVAHVGFRRHVVEVPRSGGPCPSLMWARHEMAEKSPLLHGEAVACPALPRPVWWRRPNT